MKEWLGAAEELLATDKVTFFQCVSLSLKEEKPAMTCEYAGERANLL